MNNHERLVDLGAEKAMVFDESFFDEVLIGATLDGVAVYDYDVMVSQLAKSDGVTLEQATEFIHYNTLRAIPYMGKMAPVIVKTFGGEFKC